MKSDLNFSKPWTDEFFGWLVCVKCHDVVERHQNLGNWGTIPIRKKGDMRECSNYRVICRRSYEIIKPKLADSTCGFSPNRSTTDEVCTLQQTFEKSTEHA